MTVEENQAVPALVDLLKGVIEENLPWRKSRVLRNKPLTKKAKVRCIPPFYQSIDGNWKIA
jgi:hypothetical protein